MRRIEEPELNVEGLELASHWNAKVFAGANAHARPIHV